jgi:hypothetical protein
MTRIKDLRYDNGVVTITRDVAPDDRVRHEVVSVPPGAGETFNDSGQHVRFIAPPKWFAIATTVWPADGGDTEREYHCWIGAWYEINAEGFRSMEQGGTEFNMPSARAWKPAGAVAVEPEEPAPKAKAKPRTKRKRSVS